MIIIPFSGSKRNAYRKVESIAQQYGYDSVYEPFGGSCMLSVNLWHDGYVQKAVANDYDHFFDDYEEYLDLKDKVVDLCYQAGLERTTFNGNTPYKFTKDGKKVKVDTVMLNQHDRKILQSIIKENVPQRLWRYFVLGSNFSFSARSTHETIRLSDFSTFSRYLKTDKQRYYLEVLNMITLEHLDYMDFLFKYQKEIDEHSLLIIDPPYPNEIQHQYQGTFSNEDSRELINYLNCLPCDYIYFHGDLEEIHEWFRGTDHSIQTGKGGNAHRTEYLVFVKK